MQDVVERFWDIIEDININTVLMFLRDNIVGTVIIISMLIWIPASCVFSYVDRRREAEYRKYVKWFYSSELVHPSDNVRVIVSKRTRIREPPNGETAGAASGAPANVGVRERPDGAEARQTISTPQCQPGTQHYASPM